ncbi:MAG: class I SAM-dependent methyltransferase [Verrucomicrobia bacterium]|nr:class I SAM-dependent methyltransferase [Verrucomicrobiota bacterium]
MNAKHLQQTAAAIPSWDPECLVERRCPFCGDGGKAHSTRPDGLTVRVCLVCGAFFVSPAPNETELRRLYATYSGRHARRRRPHPRTVLHAVPWDDFRLVEIESHVRFNGARVLDVGCGWGTLLKCVERLGAAVVGVDLDPDAVSFARDTLGVLNVSVGTLENVPCGPAFDVVCMFDFIEHPLDPLEQLEQAVALLAPRGVLAIWTPNASVAHSEEVPAAFRVDLEHMQYLSIPTCQWLAHELDLQVLHVESAGFPHLNGTRTLHGPNGRHRLVETVRHIASGMPGWRALRALGHAVFPSQVCDPRRGTYHLFCLFQKGT